MVVQSKAIDRASTQRTIGRSCKSKIRAEKEVLVRGRVELLDDKEDDDHRPLKELYIDIDEKSDEAKIRDALRLFNNYYLHFVQKEEERCENVAPKPSPKAASKGKKIEKKKEKTKHTARRPDLKANTQMRENNEVLYRSKRIGSIPGIEVGHKFYSRAEMVVVGLHLELINGIGYMGQAYRQGDYEKYKLPLAVSVVMSGMYEDDEDNADTIVYTGQGGHDLKGHKRQQANQVMERGNLALKNAVEEGVPIRVIRGHPCQYSYTGKLYTYDGLYKVVRYWAEEGKSKFTVFKYSLKRIKGQPMLDTDQVRFINGHRPRPANSQKLICEDISGGQERIPIQATNSVDDTLVPPKGFTYYKSIKLAENVKLPSHSSGCDCKDRCVTSKGCSCAKLNGGSFPYVKCDGLRLKKAMDVVYECGPGCGCGPECINRVSQQGIKYNLEVFRTANKGWGVRSSDFIPSGAPICEYTGVLRRTEDVDEISDNEYIFEIDCLQTMNGLGGRERRSRGEGTKSENCESAPEYCIDGGSSGNVARFINHSCDPNLFVQCVLIGHSELKLARVMLFAFDNISPLQELTYDYGYALNSVSAPDGTIKQMPCYCGAADCRKRLF